MTSTSPHQSILDKPFVLDLFAGPGGLDVAGHRLGIPSLGIEWDKSACLTRYAAGLDTLHADVGAVRRESFESLPPEINVLAGGPPCQTYSVAGKGAGREALDEVKEFIARLMAGEPDEEIDKDLENLSDPRTALVLEPLRYAIQATRSPNRGHRPYDVIVLEQVPAVRALWNRYAEVLQEIGLPDGTKYKVVVDVLRTETYGVPQTRSRAVLIARREGLGEPFLPDATHRAYEARAWNRRNLGAAAPTIQPTLYDPEVPEPGEGPTENDSLEHWTSMGDALAEPVGTHPGRRTPFLIRSNYGSSGIPGRRGVRTDRQPATTVTGRISRFVVFEPVGDHHQHVVCEGPRFSMNEAGMLQSFPPDYPWSGKAQAQQVGNAVPPLFGAHLLSAALGLPAPTPATMRKPWVPATEERRAKLRSHGCGTADDCTARCPRPE
ncbi:DNA methylase [Streptomyces anthocyanicus]|uniref:DNA cytosine methyltransferase n=2 Tax=Streptomyces violaceoruber group TaxID=2867121 RepID=A0ACD4WS42_STRVN|nr:MULTISPECIES: DNA cytosine methyltransferase [Streptomyces]WOZ00319.1 DNA cytosine methyltransferase [Streptomyces violaceoruber]BDD72423.1 DNA methylase [Streptomyces coelicolor]REH21238.1 DNA (cytosine-5)-methyltransferase 1 [Streptomyces sp. 2221.1]SDT47935.1 DNA (cytosine-5)-methyltransferase 1 [Streptomyces sp. 2114.2]GHB96498.1 DNA methylase [Streptomyces anthocyanicus]